MKLDKDVQKALRFLQEKGFSPDEVRDGLAAYLEKQETEMNKELVATIAGYPDDNRLDIVISEYGDGDSFQYEVLVNGESMRYKDSYYQTPDGLYTSREAALNEIESSYRDNRFDLQWEIGDRNE